MSRDCFSCKHSACDPDGPFCGHPEAFKVSMFGQSFNAMHVLDLCTQTEAQLFEDKRKPVRKPCYSRLALMSKHSYFAMKKDKAWFSKKCHHRPLGANALRASPHETEFERYKRLALARGDRILYIVHYYPKPGVECDAQE